MDKIDNTTASPEEPKAEEPIELPSAPAAEENQDTGESSLNTETTAGRDDGHRTAIEPVPEEPAEAQPQKREGGMSAYEPILTEAETYPTPGLPRADVPLPPASSTRGMPIASEAAIVEPGPMAGLPPVNQAIKSGNLAASPEMLDLLLPNKQLQSLWQRMDEVHGQINDKVSNFQIARVLMDDLECARNDLLAGRDHYEEAERVLNEVEYRVSLSGRVARWSYTIGSALAVYEVVWFILSIAGMLVVAPLLSQLPLSSGPASPTWPSDMWSRDLVFAFHSMMWGILGGVIGALYALWIHISRDQDFDKQYSMWYILSPLGGMVVGTFIFLIVRLGIFSLTAGSSTDISSPLIIYALAWLCGFQQNVIYDLVKRLLSIIKVNDGSETTTTTTTTTK